MIEMVQKEHKCKIVNKNRSQVEITINEVSEIWKYEKINEFDSTRKMMSVVVQKEGDESMIAFIKGADEQIYKFATKADKNSDLMSKL
tara:strand:- start:80 stop:343 length:264 start_codon:yes stop_codon:yes gene_type:complete